MKYRNLPHRIFPRYNIYDDIKMKLYANLHNSIELVLSESERIIKRYKRIEFYIEELAFGRKKEYRKNRKGRNITVDILMQKQKELMPKMYQNQNKRPSTLQNRGQTFDYHTHYRVTTTLDNENT